MDKSHFNAAVRFGRELIRTGDLDPVYYALTALPMSQRFRTALAYSCLYHLGAAAYIGEAHTGARFWDGLEAAARNENLNWPRGAERRHWRGKAATDCAGWLRANYEEPEQVFYSAFNRANTNKLADVTAQLRTIPSVGPWAAFKIADIMERCLGLDVDFTGCHLEMYEEPRRGAALLLTGDPEAKIGRLGLNRVVTELLRALGKLKAPPGNGRYIAINEIETVLCKYKSHCNGHYPPGKDLKEVAHALNDSWGRSATKMRKVLEAL